MRYFGRFQTPRLKLRQTAKPFLSAKGLTQTEVSDQGQRISRLSNSDPRVGYWPAISELWTDKHYAKAASLFLGVFSGGLASRLAASLLFTWTLVLHWHTPVRLGVAADSGGQESTVSNHPVVRTNAPLGYVPGA